MARYRQDDLYEGDGEVIGGASEDAVPLFDDFDRFNGDSLEPLSYKKKKKRPLKHRGAWIAALVISLAVILGAGMLVLPQLTGMRYRYLPNFAFANGSLIQLDPLRLENFQANRAAIYQDAIYAGVYIDDIHVGGMSREEAKSVLYAANDMTETPFNITVTVGNQSWQVNNERVPASRNIDEIVEKAWALGKSNTTGIRGTGTTPFQERVNKASDLMSFPVSYRTEKTYDHQALKALAQGIANYVNRDPVNSQVASFDFGTRTFTFTEDIPGAYLDGEALYTRLTETLDAGDYNAQLRVTPEKILASVTRTELMNSFGLISSYTTQTTSNKNRNTNILLSCQAISGTTVMPGETFSFNAATGERTAEKGYKEATAISGGASRDEIGGGVCQTSSTLFNAVARANLEIVERSPHAWPSSYVEKGMDATVNWPGLDFKFKNNTEWPIFLITEYANRKVTASVYGMSLGADVKIDLESQVTRELPQPEGVKYVINTSLKAGESKTTVTGRKGYIVDTWKIWYQGGSEVRREKLFTSTYKAYQETIEYNPR